ncbi:MAG: DoxX family protein [Bacteroidota bacterium]
MTRLFHTTFSQRALDLALVVIRICIACFMLEHGIPKLKKFFNEPEIIFADPLGFGSELSLILVIFAEVICSVFIFIGLGTRLFVIPLIIMMLVIIFKIHAADGFEKQELALHYLLIYFLLFITGSGKYSIDHWIMHKKS